VAGGDVRGDSSGLFRLCDVENMGLVATICTIKKRDGALGRVKVHVSDHDAPPQ
jgi:hypothetical protein